MRVHVVDPSAFTAPYDHALCGALAAGGAEATLITSRFSYGALPAPDGYARRELFYRRSHRIGAAAGPTGEARPRSKPALAVKLAEHVPDMLRQRRLAAAADVVHYQWLTLPELDGLLLPRRGGAGRPRRPALVLTAHDVMPRQPRPGQLRAQRRLYHRFDAIVVHSAHGRERLIAEAGLPEERVHVIPHGVFSHLAGDAPPPARQGPVVLFFGLLRPYKGLEILIEAWRGLTPAERAGAQLWIVGMPRMDLSALGLAGAQPGPAPAAGGPGGSGDLPAGARAPDDIHLLPRFVADSEIPSFFAGADLVVLPYREADQSGVLFTALAFGRPLLLSDVGGFPEIARAGAAEIVPAGDAAALAAALRALLADPARRERMAAAGRALAAPGGPHSWQSVAARHLSLYEQLLR